MILGTPWRRMYTPFWPSNLVLRTSFYEDSCCTYLCLARPWAWSLRWRPVRLCWRPSRPRACVQWTPSKLRLPPKPLAWPSRCHRRKPLRLPWPWPLKRPALQPFLDFSLQQLNSIIKTLKNKKLSCINIWCKLCFKILKKERQNVKQVYQLRPERAAFIAEAISCGEAPASARVAATLSAMSNRSSMDPPKVD